MSLNYGKFFGGIDIRKMKYGNTNMTYEQLVRKEAHRFKDILRKYIVAYYNSYSPVVYKRGKFGGNLLGSIEVDDIVKISSNGTMLYCDVLVNENAIHTSIVTKEDNNIFFMFNDGWQVNKDVWFKDIPRFGYFEGVGYIEQAVKEFEDTDKYGFTVIINRPNI